MFTASYSIFHPSCFRYCCSSLSQLCSWVLRLVWIFSLPFLSVLHPSPSLQCWAISWVKKSNSCEDGICSSWDQKPKSKVVQRNGKAQVQMAVFPEGNCTRKGSTSPCAGGLQSSQQLMPHHLYFQSHRILSWTGDVLGTNSDDLQRWRRTEMLMASSSRKLQKGTKPANHLLPMKEEIWRHEEVLVSLVLPGITMEWT